MGIRPTAHVWYGTEAVESLLFSETDEDGEEQKHLDAYDTSEKLQEEFGVQIVELYWEGDTEKFALALVYHHTDWDAEIEFEVELDVIASAGLEKAAKSIGWDVPLELKWRIAATYG